MIDRPIVTFVLPTYNRIKPLRMALSSIVCQSNPFWEAIVVIDGEDHEREILEMIQEFDEVSRARIVVVIHTPRANDWGHTPREKGKNMASGVYVIMGGDDNYYTPNLVDEIYKMVNIMPIIPGMIYWDMVHSHYDYQYFKCTPGYNQIDMGAFATYTPLAKQIALGTEYAADGLYVENFKHMFPNEEILKINKVLYVHN